MLEEKNEEREVTVEREDGREETEETNAREEEHFHHSISYHKFNESQREQAVLKRLQQGEIVAQICDAGTPGISDPGMELALKTFTSSSNVLQMAEAKSAIRKLVFNKVDQLRPGTGGHNLILKVVSSKTVLQKGRPDGPQVDLMKPDGTVILRNAKIDMFKGSMRLAVDNCTARVADLVYYVVSLTVHQAALHVWKTIVANTPKTLKEIMPVLMNTLITSLASSSSERRQNKVCIGLSEVMASAGKSQLLSFMDELILTIRTALCDSMPEVHESAGLAFSTLYKSVGLQAIDEIVPTLLQALEDDETSNTALDGLKQILKAFTAHALGALAEVAGPGLDFHREWVAEVDFLGQLHHPNLVKLVRYCIEDDQRLLVYEFMTRGSRENHLFRRLFAIGKYRRSNKSKTCCARRTLRKPSPWWRSFKEAVNHSLLSETMQPSEIFPFIMRDPNRWSLLNEVISAIDPKKVEILQRYAPPK
ncbi:unnamed protein product [Camellia sinensis]